jgi:hypothetical protein
MRKELEIVQESVSALGKHLKERVHALEEAKVKG